MNVFPRDANGDVPPARHFDAPYGSYGIAVDDAKGEMYITVQHDSAIGVWPKSADKQTNPIRSLQGAKTGMGDPHSIALDLKKREMYVVNFGTSRLAIPGAQRRARDASNSGTGLQVLSSIARRWSQGQGSSARLRHRLSDGCTGRRRACADDSGPEDRTELADRRQRRSERGEVYVANDTADSITVYGPTANGDAAPIRTIKGPRSLVKNPLGVFVDVANDEVWVANYGGHTATVYRRTANGDAAPLRVIRSAPTGSRSTMINNPYSIAYDPTRQEILVPSCVQHPRIAAFARLADADAAASRVIQGQNTRLNRTVHMIKYNELHDEIVVNSNIGQAVLTYRGALWATRRRFESSRDRRRCSLIRSRWRSTRFTTRFSSSSAALPPGTSSCSTGWRRAMWRPSGCSTLRRIMERSIRSITYLFSGPRWTIAVRPDGGGGCEAARATIGGYEETARARGRSRLYPPTGKIIGNVGGGGEDSIGGD
jgi:hypothetical protein